MKLTSKKTFSKGVAVGVVNGSVEVDKKHNWFPRVGVQPHNPPGLYPPLIYIVYWILSAAIQLPYIKEMYTVGLLNITYMKECRMTTYTWAKR